MSTKHVGIVICFLLVAGAISVLFPFSNGQAQSSPPIYLPALSGGHTTQEVRAAIPDEVEPPKPIPAAEPPEDAAETSLLLPSILGGALATEPKVSASETLAASPIVTLLSDQTLPDIAFNSGDGEYLVVYEHEYSATDHDIWGRRIDENGAATGDTIHVAQTTAYDQNPAVAHDTTSNQYLVVWEQTVSASNHDILAQRIAADGGALGGVISVSAYANYESEPDVAYSPYSNAFLVVWALDGIDGGTVYGQRYSATGVAVGAKLIVGSGDPTVGSPAVAYHPDNHSYLVVWQEGSAGQYNIRGQLVANDGTLSGSELDITSAANDQLSPQLAANPGLDTWLVVWEDHRRHQDNYADIYSQEIDTGGWLNGSNMIISEEDTHRRVTPDIVYNPAADEYMACWAYQFYDADYDVHWRRVAPYGSPIGDEEVITMGTAYEGMPSLATDDDRTYQIVWEDNRNYTTQGVDLYGGQLSVDVLSGHLYEGEAGDTSTPLPGVTIELYCSNSSTDLGTFLTSTVTGRTGAYEFVVDQGWGCDYVNIRETTPHGYTSISAASIGGTVVSTVQIRYINPLRNVVLSGNDFWAISTPPSDTIAPANWANFSPTGWVTVQNPSATIQVQDTLSGLDIPTAEYAYSTNSGTTWSAWQPASCSGPGASTDLETITAASIPFGQDAALNGQNRVKFSIADRAGNDGQSPIYAIAVDTVPPVNPTNLTSTSHQKSVWSNDSTMDMTWDPVSDPTGSGLEGYNYSWTHGSGDVGFGLATATHVTSYELPSADDWTFNLRSRDKAGNQATTILHSGPYRIDVVAPANCQISGPGTTTGSSFTIQWSYSDAHSGINQYVVQVKDGASGTWQNWQTTSQKSAVFQDAHDLHTYSFRVKATDKAGNDSGYLCQTNVEVHRPSCADGVKNRDEAGVDCGGAYCPPCAACATSAKWAPTDSPCTQHWPTNEGPEIEVNTTADSCDIVEVCHADLDYIVEDALLCCEFADYADRLGKLPFSILADGRQSSKVNACTYAQQRAYPLGFAADYSSTKLKECMALYVISSLGKNAVYMQNYFHGESSCKGNLTAKTCPKWGINPAAWEMGTSASCAGPEGLTPDFRMGGHRCEYQTYWLGGKEYPVGMYGYWNNDTNFQSNSDSLNDIPVHASINRLSTGQCVDYSLAVTTLLRKIGYSADDVYSAVGVGHAYNLVRFPSEAKFHYVDTVGNAFPEIFGGPQYADIDEHYCADTPSSCSQFGDNSKCIAAGCTWSSGSCSGTPSTNSCYWVGATQAACNSVAGCTWKLMFYDYCQNLTLGCFNDLYDISPSRCPSNKTILGCEAITISSIPWTPAEPAELVEPLLVAASTAQPDESCTELHPCVSATTVQQPEPGPSVALIVAKDIEPVNIALGDTVRVRVRVQNSEPSAVDVILEESLLPEVVYDLVPSMRSYDGRQVAYYEWTLHIEAQSSQTVDFTAKPSNAGPLQFPPTLVSSGASQYLAIGPEIQVSCVANGICDPGETSQFCPADCTTGTLDDVCDMAADGTNDPDCAYGVDPDFVATADTDGDGVADGADNCPLSVAGASVDATGCTCDQKSCDDQDPATVDRCLDASSTCTHLPDGDQDGVPDAEDNCPAQHNPDQTDSNSNRTGDACEIAEIAADITLDGGHLFIDDREDRGALRFTASNVTLDCKGATLEGNGQGYGIYVPADVQGVTIRNCTVHNYKYGVYIDSSSGHHVLDNVLTENVYGLVLGAADDNEVSGNALTSNLLGGLYLEDSNDNQISDNDVSDNGSLGVFIHTSSQNDVSNNRVCGNAGPDFDIYESTNSGDDNTCSSPDLWNDAGTTGCTFVCATSGTRVFLPSMVAK